MDIQNAVIERIKDIIEIKGITVNEVAVRFKVAPSTLKNILYEVRKRTCGIQDGGFWEMDKLVKIYEFLL